ncbi:unnamed protein product [Durusdinium trenchii]|uniref:Uncharacterized protein n=1 Tax=Durusdinium trenchii TaxID=1381693 RepID=A0ABP0LM55_9DINO
MASVHGRRRQRGQQANRLAPKADEERQWKEETIAAAQAQPWRPSWERKAFESTNNSSSTVDRCIVKPWRPSWEKDRPADSDPNRADRWQPSAVADLRRTLGRRIWASKQVSDMKQQLKNKHVVQCEDDTDALSQSDAKTSATTSLHSEAVGDMLSHDDLHSEQSYSETAQTAQESLHDILLKLKEDCERLSHEREWLFKAVRNAAAEALGQNFERMSLVGSVALKIDIPASDVDAVAFTKKPMDSVQALQATASILRNQVSTANSAVCLDMSVNQKLPAAHAKWVGGLKVFQREHARDFLRCVKYWHSQRQIPGTKEGGYPALAWLFLALHVLALHDTQPDPAVEAGSQRVVKLLREFFALFSSGSHDDLRFGGSWCSPPISQMETFWQFPSIQDPVTADPLDKGVQRLTHEIPAATQLLYAAEFRRAQMLLAEEVGSSITSLFEPREQPTSLPVACNRGNVFVIMKARKLWVVEPLAVRLRAGWTAPFLHRCDSVSKVQAQILGVDGLGELTPFPEMRGIIDFFPSDFVAAISVRCCAGVRCLAAGDLQLWQDMHLLLQAESPAPRSAVDSRSRHSFNPKHGKGQGAVTAQSPKGKL